MKTLIILILSLSIITRSFAAAVCLSAVDPTADTSSAATGFLAYQAMGLDPAQPFVLLGAASTPLFCPVDTNQTVRFYMVGTNSAGMSPPSATYTNIASAPPPSTNGVLSLSAPTLSTLNVPVGGPVTLSGDLRNVGSGPLNISAGVLNILAPGATTVNGPYITVVSIPAAQIAAGGKVTIVGNWTGTAPTGTGWNAYLAASLGGTWTAGPLTPFAVATAIGPPAAPTNLRVAQLSNTRAELIWDGSMTAKTEVWRSVELSAFQRTATVAAGTLHYSATISRHKDYAFKVLSLVNGTPSSFSNSVILSSR
jgi:hypothetical protein